MSEIYLTNLPTFYIGPSLTPKARIGLLKENHGDAQSVEKEKKSRLLLSLIISKLALLPNLQL